MLLFSTTLQIKKGMTKNAFIQSVIDWNLLSAHPENRIEDLKNWKEERNARFGDENRWMDIKEFRKENIVAIRYERKGEDGTFWDTDFVMNFNTWEMTIRLDQSFDENALEFDHEFSSPLYLRYLINRNLLEPDLDLPISYTPISVDAEIFDPMKRILLDRESPYRLPVILVTRDKEGEAPVDIAVLAWKLKGLAHVLVQEHQAFGVFPQEEADSLDEPAGMIDIYYPNKSYGDHGHSRFLGRAGSSKLNRALLDRLCDQVLRYTSIQREPALATWNGVNMALDRDRIEDQKRKKHQYQDQWDSAKETIELLKLSVTEAKSREAAAKEAVEELEELRELMASADKEIANYRKTIDELQDEITRLEAENRALMRSVKTARIPLIYMNTEIDLFPNEIKDHVLQILDSFAEKEKALNSRDYHICVDLVRGNGYAHLCKDRATEVKNTLKGYRKMDSKIRKSLQHLGFHISEDGTHYKLVYYGDNRYLITLGKTVSDFRGGSNTAADIIKKVW